MTKCPRCFHERRIIEQHHHMLNLIHHKKRFYFGRNIKTISTFAGIDHSANRNSAGKKRILPTGNHHIADTYLFKSVNITNFHEIFATARHSAQKPAGSRTDYFRFNRT